MFEELIVTMTHSKVKAMLKIEKEKESTSSTFLDVNHFIQPRWLLNSILQGTNWPGSISSMAERTIKGSMLCASDFHIVADLCLRKYKSS